MTHFISCPLCGFPGLRLVFVLGAQPVERCADCTLVFLNPQPENVDRALYAEGYFRGHCQLKDGREENVLDPDRIRRRLDSCHEVLERIEQMTGRKGRLLDLGCGPGFMLKAAQDSGWIVAGADVSPFATAHAREQFGIKEVTTASLEEVDFPDASFGVITLQHVIEHFRDPVQMIQRIRRWLVPGGILWLETPDIGSERARRQGDQWAHFKVPEHLFYFNEATLRRLLGTHGFAVLRASREVESTGLMEAACGGAERARRFYETARRYRAFLVMVKTVRAVNEFLRTRLRGESDVIRVMARRQ